MSRAEVRGRFCRALEELAGQAYHHRHPFNLLMHGGRLSRSDLRLWVANRYYYQTRIVIKDALLLAKSEEQEFRRVWIKRLHDHDGSEAATGGLALWQRLGEACGLTEETITGFDLLLPGVRQVCDEYVELVREADLLEAVASSLTECFAGELMQIRLDAWRKHYSWVPEEALAYFRERITQAREDGSFALAYVLDHAISESARARCLRAFERKCGILWRLLDAVYVASRAGMRPRLDARAKLRTNGASDAGVAVLLAPETGLALNASALELLERCDGVATLSKIVTDLALAHHVPHRAITGDIATFMAELERRRLIVFEAPA